MPSGVAPTPASAPTTPSLIIAHDLSWRTPLNELVFRDVTLALGRERVGLIGANGVGKTTLARLLGGELQPQGGTVARVGTIGFLPQTPDAVAGRTVERVLGVADKLAALRRATAGAATADDLLVIDDDWTVDQRVAAELDRVGLGIIDVRARLGSLSGGEVTRVLLASLLLRVPPPDVLILDEPTNNLDAPARAALYRIVEAWAGGMLVITHDRALLSRVDRIVELSPRGLKAYGGNFELYEQRRATDETAARYAIEHASKDLRKTRRTAQATKERQDQRNAQGRRNRRTSTDPRIVLNARRSTAERTTSRLADQAERRVSAAHARLAEAKQRVEDRKALDIDLSPVNLPAGKLVVHVDRVTYRHPGADRPLLDGFSLKLVGPRRVAITGPNGSGKTTLLKLITGDLLPDSGAVTRGATRLACLDQHAALLDRDRTILENFRLRNPELSETVCRKTLARFLFRDDTVHRLPDTLSGGQRLRAALAATLMAVDPPQLLILDEPTNHLDLDSLENLEQALRAYDGAMIVVSHDATFLERVGVEESLPLHLSPRGERWRGSSG
jgi:ATPase subunit of ABC transporter with duplicated ATPase domains